MMTLTGSTTEPVIFVISPKCFNGEPPIYKCLAKILGHIFKKLLYGR